MVARASSAILPPGTSAGQIAMAHNAGAPIFDLHVGMLTQKSCNLRLNCLSEQGARPVVQDFGQRVVEESGLNKLGHVIVRIGISLLRWRGEVVKQRHDMSPSPVHAVTNFRA
jgi:hypothetical protein